MKRFWASVALLVCTACSGGSNSGPSTSPSTTPPLAPTSETFTGTVAVGGSDFHPFTVKLSNGQVTADLTAAGPPPTITVGLGIGTFANGVCSLLQNGAVLATGGPTPQLSGSNFTTGTYCVAVFDAGNQQADITYSVTVTHY